MPYKDPERNKACRKAWNAANKERKATTQKAWYEANKERCLAACRDWRAANKGRRATTTKAWAAANPEKCRSYDAHRRALKSRACPAWADRKAIEAIYAGCPEDHHVDHIHPLKGRHWRGKWEPGDSLLWLLELPDGAEDIDGNPISTRVSIGLHIPLNLMPLPDEENLSKSNQAPQSGYFDWFGHSLVNGLHV
jgi:hypothetical protein